LTVTPAQAKPRAFLTQRGRQLPSQFASSNSPRFAALHDD
jgi:tetratricopeptide (TPR) repeat protein